MPMNKRKKYEVSVVTDIPSKDTVITFPVQTEIQQQQQQHNSADTINVSEFDESVNQGGLPRPSWELPLAYDISDNADSIRSNGPSVAKKVVKYNSQQLQRKSIITATSTLSFHNLNYFIRPKMSCESLCRKRERQQILFDVSGVFKPGMNAILGPTGSSKSTFLDILAGRKDTHGLEGVVRINGELQPADFKYRSGYVVQEDVILGTLTVRENLAFSAALRLPSCINAKQRAKRVEQVLTELELIKCADTKVGTEFIRGVSGGEKRRCNIGMELVLSPSILFLDEPTTGLDSSTACSVMRSLHDLSHRGRTVVFSIHQPRYSIFKLFHTIMLLSSGRVVYHGRSSEILPYFESIGYKCEQYDNPADFILDVTQGNTLSSTSDPHRSTPTDEFADDSTMNNHLRLTEILANHYRHSNIYSTNMLIVTKFQHLLKSSTNSLHPISAIPSRPFLREFWFILQRMLKNSIRNPLSILIQIISTIFMALLVGFIYFRVDSTTTSGKNNRFGAIFFIAMYLVFGNLSAIELFLKERILFIHERVSGYYRVSTYFIAKLVCDLLPMRVIPSFLFTVVVYFMVGLQNRFDKFFMFLLTTCLTMFCGCALCFAVSASTNNVGLANIAVGICYVIMTLFGGYFVDLATVTKVLSWLKYISIFRYALNSFSINEFKDLTLCMSNNSTQCYKGDIYLTERNIESQTQWDLWSNSFALGCIASILFIITYLQLRFVR